jgi:hypothetical protein
MQDKSSYRVAPRATDECHFFKSDGL